MPHETCSRFAVRSYEVDSYRHLNNSVYLSWFEQARLDFLQSLGFSYDDFADRRQWLVVARTEIDFRRPLTVGDEVAVVTSIERLGRSSVRWRQVMRHERRAAPRPARGAGEAADGTVDGAAPVAAEAATVMVFHGPDGRSVPIPEDVRQALAAHGGAREPEAAR